MTKEHRTIKGRSERTRERDINSYVNESQKDNKWEADTAQKKRVEM